MKEISKQELNQVVKEVFKTLVEERAGTCCGRCGRIHVKGTECRKPYLTGKRHCKTKK